jgi:hypothetical protein
MLQKIQKLMRHMLSANGLTTSILQRCAPRPAPMYNVNMYLKGLCHKMNISGRL